MINSIAKVDMSSIYFNAQFDASDNLKQQFTSDITARKGKS